MKATPLSIALASQHSHLTRYMKHYKGGVYAIECIAKHSETQEHLIVYRNVNTCEMWARPASEFRDMVEYNGKKVLRFEPFTGTPLPTNDPSRLYRPNSKPQPTYEMDLTHDK